MRELVEHLPYIGGGLGGGRRGAWFMRTYGETSHPNQDHGARGTARPRPSVTREVRGSKKNVLPGLLLIQDSDRIINLDIVWWWIMERPHKRPREALAGESTSTPPGMPGRCLGQKLGWVEGHGTESDRTGWCRSQREIGFKDAGPSGERVAMPSQRSHIACSSALSCDTSSFFSCHPLSFFVRPSDTCALSSDTCCSASLCF